MSDWAEKAKKKTPKMVKAQEGFEYRDVGNKLDYGIYHKDTGDKLLGWIRKYCVDRKEK